MRKKKPSCGEGRGYSVAFWWKLLRQSLPKKFDLSSLGLKKVVYQEETYALAVTSKPMKRTGGGFDTCNTTHVSIKKRQAAQVLFLPFFFFLSCFFLTRSAWAAISGKAGHRCDKMRAGDIIPEGRIYSCDGT